MDFNINYKVRVKLTDFGRQTLERQHVKFWADADPGKPHPFEPREEDAEGWSEWQLWCLMKDLGSHCINGGRLPFETGIQIVESATQAPAAPMPLQRRVQPWLMDCFGPTIAGDREERNHRFLEEALELVQACGCSASEAHQLVDYVYGRPVGEKGQEAGGVMITLAALCLANELDMHEEGERELARIWTMVEKIRAKQAAKPKHSPLPEAPTAAPLDMVLHCPACGLQHIDAPEPAVRTALDPNGVLGWPNPPHRSHLCHGCGHIWRPADVPTNGVAAVKTTGKADSPIAHPPARFDADPTGRTPGLLRAFTIYADSELRDGDDRLVAVVHRYRHDVAVRLAAAWNACLGVPTETLKAHPAPFSRLREERDDLLVAASAANAVSAVNAAIVDTVLKDAYTVIDQLMGAATVDKDLRNKVGRLLPAGYAHSFTKRTTGDSE